ncbi:hypothetical protein [Croceicoccus sp. Ery15]|uniref:hypothetical protein n=1 Tax=Croceicoccus sp. Ery15 TaxID=1703338 RepID=UPI001E48C133|nr:hypothetical protein [Croceicoccus sp. Ery15]
MFKKLVYFALMGAILGGTPAAAKKGDLTPMELQAIQAREFEVDKGTAFGAIMTVIQDFGYIVESADVSSGFITAASPVENKTGFFDALGGMQAHGNTRVTAFLMQMPNGSTKIRLNFVNSKRSSGSWGRSNEQEKPILDGEVYRNAWERIDEALFVMGALTDTAPSAAPSAAPVVNSTTTAPENVASPVIQETPLATTSGSAPKSEVVNENARKQIAPGVICATC